MNPQEIQNAIKTAEEKLKTDHKLEKQAVIAANNWVRENKTAQELRKTNPAAFRIYYKSVIIERAAEILGLI